MIKIKLTIKHYFPKIFFLFTKLRGHILIFFEDIGNMFKYSAWIFLQPRKALTSLIVEERQAIYAIYQFIILTIVYTSLCIYGGIYTEIKPTFPIILSFVGIPSDNLYLQVGMVFIPGMILMYLTVYSLVEICAMIFKADNKRFIESFSTLTFVFTLSMWIAIISDATNIIGALILHYTVSPLWALIVIWIAYAIMIIWLFINITLALKITKGLKMWQTVVTSVIAQLFWWGIMTILVV